MAQEFHNWLTIDGPYRDRIDFIASALGHCPWHWYKVEFDAEAPLGGDAGASSLDFYSRGAPAGLDELMRRHPNIAIMAIHFDLSAPAIYREVTKANQIYYHHEGDVDYYLKEADRETNQGMLERAFRDVCVGLGRPLLEDRDDEADEQAPGGS